MSSVKKICDEFDLTDNYQRAKLLRKSTNLIRRYLGPKGAPLCIHTPEEWNPPTLFGLRKNTGSRNGLPTKKFVQDVYVDCYQLKLGTVEIRCKTVEFFDVCHSFTLSFSIAKLLACKDSEQLLEGVGYTTVANSRDGFSKVEMQPGRLRVDVDGNYLGKAASPNSIAITAACKDHGPDYLIEVPFATLKELPVSKESDVAPRHELCKAAAITVQQVTKLPSYAKLNVLVSHGIEVWSSFAYLCDWRYEADDENPFRAQLNLYVPSLHKLDYLMFVPDMTSYFSAVKEVRRKDRLGQWTLVYEISREVGPLKATVMIPQDQLERYVASTFGKAELPSSFSEWLVFRGDVQQLPESEAPCDLYQGCPGLWIVEFSA